jgi:hypothetical protein
MASFVIDRTIAASRAPLDVSVLAFFIIFFISNVFQENDLIPGAQLRRVCLRLWHLEQYNQFVLLSTLFEIEVWFLRQS